jgi:hypothetical protein
MALAKRMIPPGSKRQHLPHARQAEAAGARAASTPAYACAKAARASALGGSYAGG